jgi:hypothetical protein
MEVTVKYSVLSPENVCVNWYVKIYNILKSFLNGNMTPIPFIKCGKSQILILLNHQNIRVTPQSLVLWHGHPKWTDEDNTECLNTLEEHVVSRLAWNT